MSVVPLSTVMVPFPLFHVLSGTPIDFPFRRIFQLHVNQPEFERRTEQTGGRRRRMRGGETKGHGGGLHAHMANELCPNLFAWRIVGTRVWACMDMPMMPSSFWVRKTLFHRSGTRSERRREALSPAGRGDRVVAAHIASPSSGGSRSTARCTVWDTPAVFATHLAGHTFRAVQAD